MASSNIQTQIDHLKSMSSTKFNPKLLDDVSVIAHHFKYDNQVYKLFKYVVSEEKFQFQQRNGRLKKKESK